MKTRFYRTLLSTALLLASVASIAVFAFTHTGTAQAATSGTLYVAEGLTMPDGNISVINAATNTVTSRILVGDSNTSLLQRDLAVSADKSKLYVVGYQTNSNSGSYTLYSVLLATHSVTPISLPQGSNFPVTLVADPINPAVYVLSYDTNGNGVVTLVNTASDTITSSVSLPPNNAISLFSSGVVDSTGAYLYFPITIQNTDGTQSTVIGVFSLASDTLVGNIPSPAGAISQLGISPDNSQIYALANGRIQVMNIATQSLVNSIPCNGVGAFVQNASGQLLYEVHADAVATIDPSMSNISAVTGVKPVSKLLLSTNFSAYSNIATLSADGKFLYVASTLDNAVVVINTGKFTIQTIIPVGANPQSTLFIP